MNEMDDANKAALNEMLDFMEGVPAVETPVVETPTEVVIPEKVVEAQTAPNAEDLPIEVSTPTTTTVETPAEPSIEEQLRAQIMELTNRLNQPVQQVYPTTGKPVETPVVETKKEEPAQVPVVTQEGFVPGTYLSEEELDKVIDDPRLIVTAIKRAQEDVAKFFQTQIQSQINPLTMNINQQVQQAVQQQIAVTKFITDFYDANQDLRPYAQFTQFVLAEVEAKSIGQNKTYGDIAEETARETRKRLGLPNPAVQTIERGRVVEQRPAFAGSKKGGNARPSENKPIFDQNAADILALEE